MDRRLKEIFHQRRLIDGQQEHKKMLNIANQRNANQNQSGKSPHTIQDDYHQKEPKLQTLAKMS